MTMPRRFPWSGPLLLLLLAAFLIVNFGWLHMHPDEELSYESTQDSDLVSVLQYQIDLKDNEPPGWFLVFRLWRTAAGDSEFAGRTSSLLMSMLALAIVFRMARDGFSGKRAAPLSLIVLVGNGLFFNYALDIRPYPAVLLSAACSMWMLQRWLARPTRTRAAWFGASVALMLYVHYLLLFMVIAQGVLVLFCARRRWRLLFQFGLACAFGLLLFLPWFPVMVSHIQHLRAVEAATGTGRGVAGIGVSTNATTAENVLHLLNLATNGLWPLYALLWVGGAIVLYRNRTWWLALTWAVLTPAVYLIVNLIAGVYAPRYVSHLTLGLALATGAALALIPNWRRLPLAWLAAGSLAVANLALFPAQIAPRIPYRDLFRELSAAAQPGDMLFFSDTDPNENLLRWQRQLYLRNDLPVITNAPEEWPRRVWFLTANWFNDTVQADFAALEATHPVQQVFGDCTRSWCFIAQLMEAPPLEEPVRFGGESGVPFRGLTVDAVTDDAVSMRLWWQVPANEAPPALDYSISVRLVDASGALVAQSDGPIQHYGRETVQTSAMEPGRLYMDVRELVIPPGAPPADYRLLVVVYQSWDGARLLLPDGREAWEGPVVQIN